MKQTVVGVFDTEDQARRAREELLSKGFDEDEVRLTRADDLEGQGSRSVDAGMQRLPADRDGDGDVSIGERVRHFFAELFGDDDDEDVGHYSEAVRRGGTVLRVDAEDDEDAERARECLLQAGAVDIDERAEQWRSEGWSGSRRETALADDDGRAAAMPGSALGGLAMTGAGTAARGDETLRTARAGGSARAGGEDDVIPVVRENLEVGKRVVSTGGVRVYTRIVETPVSETVQLREEHAHVERRPVDRAASEADLAGLGERTIEVTETAERAVVGKTARVVEEVVVGKTVDSRTERIEETVRSTEVQVENLPGSQGSLAGMGRSTGQDGGNAFGKSSGGDLWAQGWRQDFDAQHAGSGGRFEEYEPHYRYGHGLRGDTRWQGRDWDAIEPDVRRDWESRHPGGTWERFKSAVRRGWDNVTQ